MVIMQLILNGIMRGSVYGLLAIGLTITYGVARVLNFAHGDFVMVAMYVAFFIFSAFNIHPFISIVFVTPLFFFLGMLLYKLMFKKLISTGGITQIFTTAGLSMIIQNACLLLFSSDPRYIPMTSFNKILKIHLFGEVLRLSMIDVIGFAIAMVLMIALFAYLQFSFKGQCIRAVIDQRRGAQLVGLKVESMYRLAIALGIACVGAAGCVLVTSYNVAPSVGGNWKSIAFIAVILGGYNSLPGAVVASMLIGLIESFVGFYISSQLKEVAYFIVYLAVLVLRPNGLFGTKSTRVGR